MQTTTDRHCETLSAWFDGEPSDRDAVLEALATPEGRSFIVDVMALRHDVEVTTPIPVRAVSYPARRWPVWLGAAAAALVCVIAGFAAARLTAPAPDGPSTSDSLVFVPVSTSTAPEPTRVIRFEAGVDWRETAGGN